MKVISLGYSCYLKWIIRDCGYTKETDIFDWINTFSFNLLILSLTNNFDIFSSIKKSNKTELFNDKYMIRMPHENDYFSNESSCIEKYKRRYERFIQYKNSDEDFLFIRLINSRGRDEIPKEDLINNYSKKEYDLIIEYLPKNSKIVLISIDNISPEEKEKMYEKFIILDNVIDPMKSYCGLKKHYKSQMCKSFIFFLEFCEKNFENLHLYQNQINQIIKNLEIYN